LSFWDIDICLYTDGATFQLVFSREEMQHLIASILISTNGTILVDLYLRFNVFLAYNCYTDRRNGIAIDIRDFSKQANVAFFDKV